MTKNGAENKCDFCGFKSCKDCTKKKRQFPEAPSDADKKLQKGVICKMCDRKFIMRDKINRNLP